MKSFLILILLFSQHVFASADVDKIIGENDLVSVDETASNIPFRFRSLVDAFGVISMSCTATHIGRGYVITAGHCFWAGPVADVDKKCEDVTVAWGIRGEKKPYLISKCESVVIQQRSENGDFAIFKVSPVPPVSIAPDLYRHAASGDTLTIFSHPVDMTLQWSKLCGVEMKQDSEVPKPSLNHQCDTNPGSSGAAIINALSLKIVAIHNGGYVDEHGIGTNFGTFITDSPLRDKLIELGF